MAAGQAGVVEDVGVRLVVTGDDQVMRHRPTRLLVMAGVAGVVGVAKAMGAHADDQWPSERELLLHVDAVGGQRSEEHTSELQSRGHLVCRLLLEKKKQTQKGTITTTMTQGISQPRIQDSTRSPTQ